MADTSRRDRVGLGLIGLGPSWEQLYRQTIARLTHRLTIRLVFDPVEARARSVAAEFQAEFVTSLYQALNRNKIQGLLVLDVGWCGPGTLSLLSQSRKPVYVAQPALSFASVLRSKRHHVQGDPKTNGHGSLSDDTLMPELRLRFTPASCRLRELIATRLGPVHRIVIDCDLKATQGEVAELLDWCNDIMGTSPSVSPRLSTDLSQVELIYPSAVSTDKGSKSRAVLLRQSRSGMTSPKIEITCERGTATLNDQTHIVWQSGSESDDERLTDERNETEILIDQFCRRALGGLNPVGRMSEYLRAMELADALRQPAGSH